MTISKQIIRNTTWLVLFIAGLFEVAWAIGLKYSDGFTNPFISALTVVAMVISVVLLGLAMKTLPVRSASSVWVGIGAIGTVIFGIWLFDEPAEFFRLASVGLIIAGVVGLKLATPG